MRYCFKIGLYRQGLLHDLSKYSWTEFSVGCRYYQGNRSPNNAEREDTGLSTSWIHHYGRNKHHFEHWVDYGVDCDTVIQGVPMPRKYIAAVSYTHLDVYKRQLTAPAVCSSWTTPFLW